MSKKERMFGERVANDGLSRCVSELQKIWNAEGFDEESHLPNYGAESWYNNMPLSKHVSLILSRYGFHSYDDFNAVLKSRVSAHYTYCRLGWLGIMGI
jgi:hypothetical protein